MMPSPSFLSLVCFKRECCYGVRPFGIIEPVEFSDWAAPIVPVLKPNGTVYECVVIINSTHTESYPLPRAEDIFAALSGGKLFKS